MTKRAVIYARYSSDIQDDRSIDDQIALCRQIAARHGCKVVKVYTDRAVSGASMLDRPELLALTENAKKRAFEVVIVEAMHRLTRSDIDGPAIFRRLEFNQIKIIDQNGEVTDIHVSVNSIVDSMFLKNLRNCTKRGMVGRAREGLIPSCLAFGYRTVTGKPGEREIDPEEARIVVWIFEQYAAGRSQRDIAADLTKEKVRAPRGGTLWNSQAVGGILGNQLYIGKLVWNARTSMKNPDTGKRHFRPTAEDAKITTDVPHLRIIDQDLWERAHAVLAERSDRTSHGPRRWANKDHFLIGLLTCAACGGAMIIGQTDMDGTPRVVCSYGHRRMNCTHTKSYGLKALETIILDGIKAKLTDRKALLEFTRAYHGRWAERQKAARAARDTTQKQLNRVTVKIDRTVAAIASIDGAPVEELVAALKALRVEKAGLTERLKVIDAESNVVTLHPKAIDEFANTMEEMHEALSGGLDKEALAPFHIAFRSVFERIVVHPTGKRKPYEVTPYARLGAIMGIELFPKMSSVEEMLAEQGVVATKILPSARSR